MSDTEDLYGQANEMYAVLLDGKPVAMADVLGATLVDAAYSLDTLLGRASVDGLPEYREDGAA